MYQFETKFYRKVSIKSLVGTIFVIEKTGKLIHTHTRHTQYHSKTNTFIPMPRVLNNKSL